MQNGNSTEIRYAGFWRRFIALIIDFIIVELCLFPFVLLLAVFSPGNIVLSVPFDLFTTERVLETEQIAAENGDDSKTEKNLIEVTVLGRWTYLYDETISYPKNAQDEITVSRDLLDPVTRHKLKMTSTEDILFFVIFIYWILMESSRYQGSLGKRALGIKVVDRHYKPLGIPQAIARNLLKFLSAFIAMIGFMMAGWTLKKRSLHDMIARCYVTLQD